MIPHAAGVVAIVGRPNVGKSTIFNRLCKRRDALVHDRAGLTRDRKYGIAHSVKHASITVIDTGGLHDEGLFAEEVDGQVNAAIVESDLVLFVVDARDGLTHTDLQIADELRISAIKPLVVANKIDGITSGSDFALSEFSQMGFDQCLPVSATNGQGFTELVDSIVDRLPPAKIQENTSDSHICVSVLGRPNVGKSTLVNSMVQQDRCIVFDEPGTTRDAIHVEGREKWKEV